MEKPEKVIDHHTKSPISSPNYSLILSTVFNHYPTVLSNTPKLCDTKLWMHELDFLIGGFSKWDPKGDIQSGGFEQR